MVAKKTKIRKLSVYKERRIKMHERAIKFCKEVRELAKIYELSFFALTEGENDKANNKYDALRVARENNITWEMQDDSDPSEDWSEKQEVF